MSFLERQETGQQYIPDTLEQRRKEFISDLVNCGEISLDFAQSGRLDRFNIDEATGTDSLKHMLVGETDGSGANGIHHLRTILSTNTLGRFVASKIAPEMAISDDPEDQKAARKLVKQQKVRKDGTSRPFLVGIEDGYSDYGVKFKTGDTGASVREGSTMFPNNWSTQNVLEAVLEVAEMEPTIVDEDRASCVHLAEFDGVKVRVITSIETGKIITAYPVLRKS